MHTLRSPRLTLRRWRATDAPPSAALNAGPAVTEFPGRRLSYQQSAQFVRRAAAELAQRGWGLWALGRTGEAGRLGCVGLAVPALSAHFTPCLEVLRPLAREHRGCGYATEAARACLSCASGTLALPQVVSLTAAGNARSRAVMERLGMQPDEGGDFGHPHLPDGHRLRRHGLYRMSRERWPRAPR